MLTNIRPELKLVVKTNTLAYFSQASVTKKNSFMTLVSDLSEVCLIAEKNGKGEVDSSSER